ncbi:hypothetical protein GQ457_02G030170 [Hibiscus cannabinus]
MEEVKTAAFSMGADKAPRPDGFPGCFYHSFWDIIKDDMFAMVSSFFSSGFLDYELNNTNIVLIPKKSNPCEIQHFRPISLCNFSMKVITKILASRLKKFLPDVISPQQSAFVDGRLIQDNIILAHEAFHAIKRARKGSKGVMALKIDMEKAYDKETPVEVWLRSEVAFKEFSSAQARSFLRAPHDLDDRPSWTPPQQGHFKVACDAAFDKHTGKAAAAAVARDSSGRIVAGDSDCFFASSASTAEALAIRLGVTLALSVGLDNVIVESDCKEVIYRLISGVQSAWESAAVEEDILSRISSLSTCSFSFVPRSCNRVADWVAKNISRGLCPRNWVSNPPPELETLL